MNFGMSNPWLGKMGEAITNQVTSNLNNNILPGIRSGAQSVGAFGGSRQGNAEGQAIGQTNQALSNSLANMYGQSYANDQNFYTAQRGQDIQQAGLGASLFGQGMTGLANQGLGMYGAGQQQFNAGALPFQTYGNMLSPFTGLNQQMTQPGPNMLSSLIGGGLTGMQLYNIFKGW